MNVNMKYIDNIFKDVDGHPSSKRWVTFICLISLLVAFFADLFYGYKMDAVIYDGIKDITIAGLGFTGLEQFAKKSANGPTTVTATVLNEKTEIH